MTSRTVLVTGSTNGIGQQAALDLARLGATVIVSGRSPEKVRDTVDALRSASGHERIDGIVADLSVLSGITTLADTVRQRYDRLDVLLNNAGALFTERQLTVDGFERTFALNHLAYFELTRQLLDLLKASAPARIINVASDLHAKGELHFEDPSLASSYAPLKAYAQSKLANVMFTYELARRLDGSGVTANAMHPGMVQSGFGKGNRGVVGRLTALGLSIGQRLFGVDVVKGADTAVYLASAPEVEGRTGGYWYRREQIPSSPASRDEPSWERLWEMSEAMVARQHQPA